MDNIETISIFTESSENMGILYDSYKDIYETMDEFLKTIESSIKELIDDPSGIEIDIKDDIEEFKKSIDKKFTPVAIDINKISSTKKTIKNYRDDVDEILNRLSKAKNKISFGGNWYRFAINRPKIYSKEIDEGSHESINKNIRAVNRGLDWIEKTIIDLYNLIDQDLNILTIVDKVYSKNHVYESTHDKDIADMNPKSINEATWIVNTRNKKTGEIPGYIANNHNLEYGEEDPNKNKPKSDPSDEPSLDDYRRPSASNSDTKPIEPIQIPSAYDNSSTDEKEDKSSTGVSDEDKRMINNYYYYNYTNSLNDYKKSYRNSFNKDNHSTKDNHSSVTQINSHNKNEPVSMKDDSDIEENAKPWKLNIFDSDQPFVEDVGDADFDKPKSDHPVKDILTDIDRGTTKVQQEIKKKAQDVQNVGRIAMKPINRTKSWVLKTVNDWKDKDENDLKEKLADPHARNNLFTAIRKAIEIGSFAKAGLLFNPIFLFLTATRGIGKNKRMLRIRNEMISEIKAEIEIIDEKIRDADSRGSKEDKDAKYKLMRLKNELNKKLIRVGSQTGGKNKINKMI